MMHPTKFVRLCATVLAVTVSIITSAQAGTFNQVAIHPEVALQPTSAGNRIATLKPFNGRLYAGYGDYGANTGPVAIRAYDPLLGDFTASMLTFRSEAAYIYREIGGKLYAPNIDTTIGGTGYAVGTAGVGGALDTWQDLLPVGGIHMFDMAEYGGNLFMGGSSGNDAMVWTSADNGTTWTEALRVNPIPDSQFSRVYALAVYDGKLIADVEHHTSAGGFAYLTRRKDAGHAQLFDGTSWVEGPVLTKDTFMSHPEVFAGKLVYQNSHPGWSNSELTTYDGKFVRNPYKVTGKNGQFRDNFWDYTIDNGVLYGLQRDVGVVYTTDLSDWYLLDAAPIDARSIGILNDTLYLGAAGGLLYEYDTLLSALPAPSLLVASEAFGEGSSSLVTIPEPASAMMMLVGVTILATRRRARRQAA